MSFLHLCILVAKLAFVFMDCGGIYNFPPCCVGEKLDKSKNICTKCPRGFYGSNCTHSCVVPYFGHRCVLGRCTCNRVSCKIPTPICSPTTACPIGYHGYNCRERCDYPYYGKDCTEGTCSCEKELCDIATGCRHITTKEEKPAALDLLSSETTFELNTRNTAPWDTFTPVRKEKKSDMNQSTLFTFENPLLLIILSVNFVFFVIISIYVYNKVKKACSPTSSAVVKEIKDPDINLDPYQALQTDTYAEISMDYNTLNDVGPSVEKPLVVKVDSPVTSNTGERTDYDDIANVVEHK